MSDFSLSEVQKHNVHLYPFRFGRSLLVLLAISFSMLAASSAPVVPLISKADKLEGKLREAIVKSLRDIHIPIIKAAALKTILDDTNLILIDIRQTKEQDVSMLPHALTTLEFAEKFRHGIPSQKRIVVYCTIGYRSGKYAETLAKQGIKAENLEGGILAWSYVVGPLLFKNLNGERAETNRIHIYDKDWNFVHPDYVAVW